MVSGLIGFVGLSLFLGFAPVFPHTLYCFDLPIRPPYRESYLAYSVHGPGSTRVFGYTSFIFAGRAWLRFWPWLSDQDDITDNVFYKAAISVAASDIEVLGKHYPAPTEGLAYARVLQAERIALHTSCDLAAIGARDVPPGTPWR